MSSDISKHTLKQGKLPRVSHSLFIIVSRLLEHSEDALKSFTQAADILRVTHGTSTPFMKELLSKLEEARAEASYKQSANSATSMIEDWLSCIAVPVREDGWLVLVLLNLGRVVFPKSNPSESRLFEVGSRRVHVVSLNCWCEAIVSDVDVLHLFLLLFSSLSNFVNLAMHIFFSWQQICSG